MNSFVKWFMEHGHTVLGAMAGLMASRAYHHILNKEKVIGIICLVTSLLSAVFAGIMISMGVT